MNTVVITPAATRDLIALEDFKTDAGITVDTDDAYLERAISRASAVVESYCSRVFAVETVSDTFNPDGAYQRLRLSRFPVVEVTSITDDGVTLVEDDDYVLDYKIGVIRFLARRCSDALVATYSAGYETIPLDIQGAVGEIVKALQFNKSRDPSLKSENILSGLYAYSLFDANSSGAGTATQVSAVLEPYRNRSL